MNLLTLKSVIIPIFLAINLSNTTTITIKTFFLHRGIHCNKNGKKCTLINQFHQVNPGHLSCTILKNRWSPSIINKFQFRDVNKQLGLITIRPLNIVSCHKRQENCKDFYLVGLPRFIPIDQLRNEKYLIDDTIYIKVQIHLDNIPKL